MSSAITESQRDILESLVCERFRVNEVSNKEVLKSFENINGRKLIKYAAGKGFEEDKIGSTAYYIVKTADGLGLFFFSLKCGELFSPLNSEEEIRERMEDLLVFRQAVENAARDAKDAESIYMKLKLFSERKGLSLEEVVGKLGQGELKRDLLTRLKQDKVIEANNKIVRVDKTYSGIQLVHFCANKNSLAYWNKLGFARHMGETLFWHSVAPLMFRVTDAVGCEYAFLFAADLSEDNSLIRYYQQSLKFDLEDSVGANKPTYDLCCSFMCQKMSSLVKNQRAFFDHFNMVPSLKQ